MSHARAALALALAASLAGAGVAQAAAKPKPKPVCHQVADAAGDANGKDTGAANPFPLPVGPSTSPVPFPVVNAGPSSDALDITSADVSADKKNLTAVIRVKKLALVDHTAAPLGIRWELNFTAEEIQFTVMAHTDPTGKINYDSSYFVPANGIGSLYGHGSTTGFFDLARNEIHVSTPNAIFSSQATIKPGAVLSDLNVAASDEVAVPDTTGKLNGGGAEFEGTLGHIDTAATTKPYKVGTLSCVVPGK